MVDSTSTGFSLAARTNPADLSRPHATKDSLLPLRQATPPAGPARVNEQNDAEQPVRFSEDEGKPLFHAPIE